MNDAQAQPLRPGAVTRLVAQKKDPTRVSVYLDGAFALGLHRDVVIGEGLGKGQLLDVEAQQRLIRLDLGYRAYARALRYLGHRARTVDEVRRKLAGAGFPEAVVDGVVERLEGDRVLDDEAFADAYVRARVRNRGYGPRRLRAELRRKGVPAPVVEAVMETFEAETNTLALARMQAEKRWGRLASEPDLRKRRKKLNDYLLRRGFDYDTVRRVVEEVEKDDV